MTQPVFLTNAGDSRLFVVEKGGHIKIVGGGDVPRHPRPGLDGGEQGLLGLAFHPDYASNGLFYVFYTAQPTATSVVAEFKRTNRDPNSADPNSRARRADASSQPVRQPQRRLDGVQGRRLPVHRAWATAAAAATPEPRPEPDIAAGQDPAHQPARSDGNGPLHYASRPTTRSSARPARTRSGPTACATRGAARSTAMTGDLWFGDVGQDSYEEIDHVRARQGRQLRLAHARGPPLLQLDAATRTATLHGQLLTTRSRSTPTPRSAAATAIRRVEQTTRRSA